MKALSVTATRRSRRNSAKGKGPSRSSIEKCKPSATASSSSKVKIGKVLDFNKSADLISYLVEVEGTESNTWLTESVVENLDVLTSYKQQIEAESGYSVDQVTETDSSKRPSRFSKTKALVAMKHPVNLDDSSDDEEFSNRGTKRKSNKVDGSTRKASNKLSSGGKVRKTKAQLLLETQLQERLERQRERRDKDADAIVDSIGHTQGKDCCLMCAANDYRKCLEQGDFRGFKALFKDEKNIPHFNDENKLNGLDLIGYAIVLEKFDFAEFAAKGENRHNFNHTRLSVPEKYKSYGDDTGFNAGYRGGQAFRKVQESRGNRLGNSAFYANPNNKETYLNVEGDVTDCEIRHYLPFITRDVFKNPTVIENYISFAGDYVSSMYYAANAGNRLLAHALIDLGNGTFNDLHREVLKFDGRKKLSNYRRNQILKRSSEALNITPYHCAAIHPSSNYLEELYEALDAAERLETDSFGRSVAFYAAVSETSACLEFLISKGFNLTMYDKHKMTPLLQAARFGRTHNVEILIKEINGGQDATDISEATYQTLNRNRRSALHYAAYFGHAETCRLLINYHAPVESVEQLDKQTALHYAAKNGHLECVRILIEEGHANPEKADKYGRSALHLACIAGHLNIVKYLLSQGLNANVGDSSNNHPVHYAAAFGHLPILHLLIEYGNADPTVFNVWRTTACSIANTKGHLAIVKYLLQLKDNPVDVNFKDQDGYTILQHTINEEITSETEMIFNLNKIKLLVSMKADPNSDNLEGSTSLHILAQKTQFAHLYEKGALPFYPTKNSGYFGTTPSNPYKFEDMDGIEYHLSIARILIEQGANLNAKNTKNETPLSVAMNNNHHHLVALLIEEGARFWLDTDSKGNNFFHYFGRLAAYISRYQPHCESETVRQAKFLSIANKIWSMVQSKLTENIDLSRIINSPNHDGYIPLIFSVKSAIDHQRAMLQREKTMINAELWRLTKNGQRNYNGYTSSKEMEELPGMIDVELKFNLKFFIELMEKFVALTKPHINAKVVLPKDFKKKNPNAKKSDYPAWTGYSALHFACQAQALDLMEFLLRSGAGINETTGVDEQSGKTPMIVGYHKKIDRKQELLNESSETIEAMKNRFNVTKPDFNELLDDTILLLIRHGASPYMVDPNGNSALSMAVANGDLKNVQAMCKVVPLSTDNINEKNEKEETSLMVALNLKKGPAVDQASHYSEIFKALLSSKADPNVLYPEGDSVLMKAMQLSLADHVKILIENTMVPIDHSHQNKKLDTALTVACKMNHPEILPLYLNTLENAKDFDVNHFNSEWCTPLSYVCKNGNLEAAQILLSLGANPNHCKPQFVPLLEAIQVDNLALVQALLEHGASVSQCDTFGNSALHIAVLSENSRIVDCLLKFSADVNATNDKNQTPLHLAIETTKKQTNRSFRVERSLINHGADLNALDFFNRTPLHYVFINSNIVPITKETIGIKKKVDVLAKEIDAEKSKESEFAKYATDFSLDEPSQYGNGKINSWLKEFKKRQIEKEAAEKEKNKKEQDKIIIYEDEKEKLLGFNKFSWEGENSTAERFDPIDIAKYLLHFKGVQLDAVDYFGRTPLHYAARVGAFSCTNLLIEKGVNLNIVDTDSNGALQLALRGNFVDYSLMLFNNGAKISKNIVLQNGKEASTFGFSLSKSLINIAYLVMDSGLSLVELIGDALCNGKFHMVEVLLQTSEDKALCETLPESGKNLWHVLADFTPFNSKIWEDYLTEFISKLSSLDISITKDKYGRTPLHYAAKHGQADLLADLCHMNGASVTDVDKDFVSVLEFAVGSRDIKCVKILLDAGAIVSKHKKSEEKSALLTAVANSDLDIAELLLQNDAPFDDGDTENGWSNSVMITCLNKNLKMLELLIKYGADLNKLSNISLKDKKNKEYNVSLPPIFIASNLGDELMKAFLLAGGNPNVHGPESEKKYGRSCFMYNVFLNNSKNMELLLDHKIDLNAVNRRNSRSIFYEFFFWKMLGNQDSEDSKVTRINAPAHIFEKMLKLYTPEVSKVDPITNMTPLELAINKTDLEMVQKLLSMGADVNIESCGDYEHASIGYLMNRSRIALPAILHALLQNNADILNLICNKSQVDINWKWKDNDGNNILAYITGALSGFSLSEIGTLLKFVKSKVGAATFKELLKENNNQGVSPIACAYHRKDKSLYKTLLKLDSTLKTFAESTYDASLFPVDDRVAPMELDGISMQQVEEFAQVERENLRREKELEDIKNGVKDTSEKDDSLKVDPYSKLTEIATVEMDETISVAYNVTLMKVELQSWGDFTDTSIYNLAIYFNKLVNVYVLWTRWGPFGREGQHQKTPYLTKEEAVAEFKSIFKAKTGNVWETHKESFEVKLGRYEILEKAQHPKDTIIKNFDFLKSDVESQLPVEVLDVLKLVCNYKYLSKVYKDTRMDMPLGQIPQSRIEEARNILKETSELIDTYSDYSVSYSDRSKIAQSKVYANRIAQNCLKYSKILPRYGDANKPIRSLYNHDKSVINKEIAKMDDLSYVGFAADVILAAKHHVDQINPLDYAYRTLDCALTSIPTTMDNSEYTLIKKYMDSTSHQFQDVVRLYAVHRAEEEVRYRPFENDPNRKLLWHGSRIGNFMGILKQGLRVAPGTSENNGALLGSGVYFADTFAKSLNYSTDYYGDSKSPYKIMLLCEVALGTKQAHYVSTYIENLEKYDSVHGQGNKVPDPNNAIYDANNVCIPLGPCISYRSTSSDEHPSLNYNEFVVNNADRVKIKYLLVLRETNTCYLCSSSFSLKPVSEHDVSKYDFREFNAYEKEIVKAYLIHKEKTAQDIFNQELDGVLESKSYKNTWDTPLDMQKDDKVCKKCCSKMVSNMVEQYMINNKDSSDILDAVNQRPRCKYGKECYTQNKISHSKHYSHWFYKKIEQDKPAEQPEDEQNSSDEYEESENSEDEDTEMDDKEEEDGSDMDEDD